MTKVLDMRHSVEEAVAAAEKPLLPQGISQLRSSYYWYSTVVVRPTQQKKSYTRLAKAAKLDWDGGGRNSWEEWKWDVL